MMALKFSLCALGKLICNFEIRAITGSNLNNTQIMVVTIVIINVLIASILLYIARRLWLLRQKFQRINNKLIAINRSAGAALAGTPNAIYKGQMGLSQLKQRNEPLQVQILRVRQVLSLLSVGQQAWQRFSFPNTAFLRRQMPRFRK